MKLYPAMDFIEGKCVRLCQGDFNAVETFDASAIQWAQNCESLGVERLHMVDLDGALSGQEKNRTLLRAVRAATLLPIQIGGGIRSEAQAVQLIGEGFDVILGTLLLTDPEAVQKLVAAYPDQVIASVDCKNGKMTLQGWTETTEVTGLSFVKTLVSMGFKKIIYTDISKDGTLAGPNLEDLSQLLELSRQTNASFELVASGGVGTLADLSALKALGLSGVIVGKALLSGAFSLESALAVCHAD